LKIIGSALAYSISKIRINFIRYENLKLQTKYLNLCLIYIGSNLCGEFNVQILSDILKDQGPSIFFSEGVLLLLAKDESLLRLKKNINSNNEIYTASTNEIGMKSGLTYEAIIQNKYLYIKNPELNKKFNSQIDNGLDLTKIKNMYIIPIFGSKNNLKGVLYLYNQYFKGDKEIFHVFVT